MKLIIGNWKMFPSTLKEGKEIVTGVKKVVRNIKRTKVVLCPPTIFAESLLSTVGKSKGISIGAQDSFCADEGAHTGETSPKALRGIGVSHVILGHSERRTLGETDELISKKVSQAIKNKLTVVLCVGERTRDEAGEYFNEVRDELRHSLHGFPRTASKQLVIAYEPIWAIGARALRPATPEDFHQMSILIRKELVEHFGKIAAFKVPVLYGGSVDEQNAEGFLKDGGADGLLIGRASLSPVKLGTIIQLAERIR